MTERFIVDGGTLIDTLDGDNYDYVSDVCPVCNKLWKQTERFARHNSELEKENEQLKEQIKELQIENEAQSDAIDGLEELLAHMDLGDVE